jgi:hypothetical protein
MEQRLLKKSSLNYTLSKKDPYLYAKVASKYQGGIKIHSTKINQYGKLVSLITESNLVKKSLEKNINCNLYVHIKQKDALYEDILALSSLFCKFSSGLYSQRFS